MARVAPLRRSRLVVAVVLAGVALVPAPGAGAKAPARKTPPVVVATFDTGTNPFHPCFRRPGLTHPRNLNAVYPASSKPLKLTFRGDYPASLEASEAALDAVQPNTLYHVPNTNLSFYGGRQASTEFVDNYPHGAQASSQIGCREYGMAPDAQLVILNWYDDPSNQSALLTWVARQPWIDVVHLNIQDIPIYTRHAGIRELIATGKLVVIAAGNGVLGQGASYPMELSSYNGPRGSLIAGANDNGGWASYSNLNPHVVMDGVGTVAAAPNTFGQASFSGTSSASPRITGYAAKLIHDVRAAFGHAGYGLVTIPAGRKRPSAGPLTDGKLSAAELHEVIRRTANPNPHASKYDGESGVWWVPQPANLPVAFYPKMGYGEVSEHTLPGAFAVVSGTRAMPERPHEDRFYATSESLRS